MGTKLSVNGSSNLYDFWSEKITKKLNEELKEKEILVNLASNEYSSCYRQKISSKN